MKIHLAFVFSFRHASYLAELSVDQQQQIKLLKRQKVQEKLGKQLKMAEKKQRKEEIDHFSKPKRPMSSYMLFKSQFERGNESAQVCFMLIFLMSLIIFIFLVITLVLMLLLSTYNPDC